MLRFIRLSFNNFNHVTKQSKLYYRQYSSKMESQNKIHSYFSSHPSLNVPLQQDQPYIAELVRQTFGDKSLRFYYEELDIMEENFFDEKMEEVFESYALSREPPFSLKQFMLFFVRQDKKLKLKYETYDAMNKQAKQYLNGIEKKKIDELQSNSQDSIPLQSKLSKSHSKNQSDRPVQSKSNQLLSEQDNTITTPADTSFKKSLFSPNRPLDDMMAIKRRLRTLFDIYNRKHYTNKTSLTFDQIPNQVATFNLNVWMLFNRDFGFTKILKKNDILAIFKKYSDKQLMGFELFEVAIFDLFKKSFPSNKNQGWKVLSIDSEQSYHLKLKQLGVPYLDESQIVQPTSYYNPGPHRILEEKNQNIRSNIKSIVKTPSTIKKQKLDPFAKIHLENPIHVQNDDQDRLFMREYRLNNKNNKYVVNYEQKRIIDSSPSTGLLKRLDERIKKYANL